MLLFKWRAGARGRGLYSGYVCVCDSFIRTVPAVFIVWVYTCNCLLRGFLMLCLLCMCVCVCVCVWCQLVSILFMVIATVYGHCWFSSPTCSIVCVCVCVCVCVYVCLSICQWLCVCVCVYVCLSICQWLCVCVIIFIGLKEVILLLLCFSWIQVCGGL